MNLVKNLCIEPPHSVTCFSCDCIERRHLNIYFLKGNSEFVEWLVNLQSAPDGQEKTKRGVNVIDNDGRSPLHLAAEKGE